MLISVAKVLSLKAYAKVLPLKAIVEALTSINSM